ncbi:AlbA family DNA-binding domain-containing protein [Streptacidiphilus albus]|uniref:AlbA family DNA-binding domain-containing protein n=1 Tax=Streptacidiphilus albus TaxID=105425 RepID=UPI00054C0141|nr:ATP-binding protein [Streptacidiphilus albus]
MTVSSRMQLITALVQRDPDRIIGTRESDWVDFKSVWPGVGPYDLGTDKGKYELAKDVAAFANAGGGLIVCGFKAVQKTTELYETATKATPFGKELVKPNSYKDVLTEYLRPLVKVDFHWFDHPDGDQDTAGHYFVIEVAPLPEQERWAIVTRGLNEDGKFVRGAWAIPVRNGDTTAYLSPDEVYRLVNDGLRVRRGPAARPTPHADRAAERAALRSRLNMDDTPVLFFQSTPSPLTGLLPGMYATGGVVEALTHQDTLRGVTAFNFASGIHRPEPLDGGLLLTSPPRWGLWVEADGSVTAAVAADREMLGWAMESYGSHQFGRISVFVLTEITLEYFRLVDRAILPRLDGPWTHSVVAVGFAQAPPRTLAPGADPEFPFQGAPQPATSDAWSQSWEAFGDPERDAHAALQRLYPLFGLDVAANPFTDPAAGRVDPQRLVGVS